MNIDRLMIEAEQDCAKVFAAIDRNEEVNTQRVLAAFERHQVAARHFAPTTGYGYDDVGRDTLERIYADLFRAEEAIVRPHLTSGTHTLSMCLFGLLLPGDHLLAATGDPYDTMQSVIGLTGEDETGTLKEMGVTYSKVELLNDHIDMDSVLSALKPETRVVLFQRSRGYAWRDALPPEEIGTAIQRIRAVRPDIFTMVDNCYGEFTTDLEPSFFQTDVMAGSLIKNLGGGIAPTGGYAVGTHRAIHRIEMRLTAPGIGRETGSYAASYRPFYQGLFMAPHTVAQALKTAVLAARAAEKLGLATSPAYTAKRYDIIQAIRWEEPERLIAFCQGIQASSPVDAFASPEPWDMPGYQDQVIMAAGTFVSGASVELSADAPMRAPYNVYLQGGLTYAHGKTALRKTLDSMDKKGLLPEKSVQGTVDLHMHSTCSDGVDTPEELAEKCKEKGLVLAALTDHEQLAGQKAFQEACRKLDIRTVTGVELDTLWRENDVHILGYGFDVEDAQFAPFVERNFWLLKEMSRIMIGRLAEDDARVSLRDFEVYVPSKKGYYKAYHYLMDRGVCAASDEVYALYGRYQADYHQMPFPTAEEAIAAIHRAGGKAVLAHPRKTFRQMDDEGFRSAVQALLALPFDGVECFYPSHNEETAAFLATAAKNRGMMVTAGSDYHGWENGPEPGAVGAYSTGVDIQGML